MINRNSSTTGTRPRMTAQWKTNVQKPQRSPATDERIQDLLVENRRLKEEVAQLRADSGPIRMDPKSDRISIVNLETQDFRIHELRMRLSSLSETFDDSMSLEKLIAAGESGEMLPMDLDRLQKSPIEIEKLKLSMPGATLTKSTEQMSGDQLAKNDLKDLSIQAERGDTLSIRGKVDKLIDIPFELKGKLGVQEGNKVSFTMKSSKVFGVFPVPKLFLRIASRVAGKDMEEMGVVRQGNTFLMDADDFLPESIQVQLTRVGTEKERLVLEGKAPQKVQETNERAPSNPTTLTVLEDDPVAVQSLS